MIGTDQPELAAYAKISHTSTNRKRDSLTDQTRAWIVRHPSPVNRELAIMAGHQNFGERQIMMDGGEKEEYYFNFDAPSWIMKSSLLSIRRKKEAIRKSLRDGVVLLHLKHLQRYRGVISKPGVHSSVSIHYLYRWMIQISGLFDSMHLDDCI